jgi:uncharacterized protein YutE (UPF0331/DUF86 family)
MVRREVVRQKAARAIAWLNAATPTLERDVDDFRSDVPARDLAVFYLFLALQECIDIAAHWVSDEGWGPPDDVGSTFEILADRGVITRALATSMRAAAGLRNRIAHGYALLDHERLHRESTAGLASVRDYLAVVSAQTA